MNRLLWGIAFLVLAAAGGWAQSTWRGQAEVWSSASAPVDGFVAASNEFPRNSLLSVENYKTKKTIQVRVVAALPAGSSALVLLNLKAARALEIKAGDAPMVGVRLDPTGADLAQNPDPDINPLASRPAVAEAPAVTPTPTPAPEVTPEATPAPAPVAKTEPLLPLPSLAAPEPVPEPARTPLAVADEPEAATPVTPGKKVFVTTRNPEPVAAETPVVTEPVAALVAEPEPEPVAAPVVEPEPEPVPAPAPAPAVVETKPAPEPTPTAEPTPAVPEAKPAVAEAKPATTEAASTAAAVKAAPATGWVSVPSKLEGPVLGQVAVLPGLEKGRAYVQVGAWATEADVLKALESVKSYVPLALYQAEGEKNPWRIVAPAPRTQLGVLLALFKSEGFRVAALVKG
jgi:hypothetical protein